MTPQEKEIFGRARLLLGDDAMQKIHSASVIIFGVGGVGSWCAEAIVRAGFGRITIVDSDCVAPSNINRQLMATTSTIGKPKVEVLGERLRDINPDAQITALQAVFCEDTAESFHIEDYDYVIDCIDSLGSKAFLLVYGCRCRKGVFSSMGAALKIDPSRIHTAELWDVKGCPMGFALRKKMRRSGLLPSKKVMCVYSDEVLQNRGEDDSLKGTWDQKKAVINGTSSYITAIFGFTIAGLVVKDITKEYYAEESTKGAE